MSHTAVYNRTMGYVIGSVRLCEHCGVKRMAHVHHIEFRSTGGDDSIENLIGLCLDCHELAHSPAAAMKEKFKKIVRTRQQFLKWRKGR